MSFIPHELGVQGRLEGVLGSSIDAWGLFSWQRTLVFGEDLELFVRTSQHLVEALGFLSARSTALNEWSRNDEHWVAKRSH
jgi:hypothetical protein